MPSFGKALVAMGVLCVGLQVVEVHSSSHDYTEVFTATYYGRIQNFDESATSVTCTLTNVRHEAHCILELERQNGTKKPCQVELAVPETNRIDLGAVHSMNLKTMPTGNKAELEWYSWRLNDTWEPYKLVSFIDTDTCISAHLLATQENELRTLYRSYAENFIPKSHQVSLNVDEHLVRVTCYVTENHLHKANCSIKFKPEDGTCNVTLFTDEANYIDLGMGIAMDNMSTGKVEWYSWRTENRWERLKSISYVDISSCVPINRVGQVDETLTYSRNYTENVISLTYEVSQESDENLLYAMCRMSEYYRKFNCLFKFEPLKDTEDESYGCNVTSERPGRGDMRTAHFREIIHLRGMLGGKRAVFEWAPLIGDYNKNGLVSLNVLDVENCILVQLDYPLDDDESTSNFHVVVYDESFHVFLNSEVKCGRYRNPCILRYDHNGDQIGQPVPLTPKSNWLSAENWGRPMAVDRLDSISGGFFAGGDSPFFRNDAVYRTLYHVNHKGSVSVVLKNHFMEFYGWTDYWRESSEHGYYSLCHPIKKLTDSDDDEIRCIQYKSNGQQMMNTTMALKESRSMLRIFNRRSGGIVIVHFDLEDLFGTVSPRYHLKMAIVHVKVKVLKMDGNVAIKANLTELDLRDSYLDFRDIKVNHLETDTNHCFYFVYAIKYGKTITFRHLRKCIYK